MALFAKRNPRTEPVVIKADAGSVKTQIVLSMMTGGWELRNETEHMMLFSRELGEGARAFDVILKDGEEFGAVVEDVSFAMAQSHETVFVCATCAESSVRRHGSERRQRKPVPKDVVTLLADVKQRCGCGDVGLPNSPDIGINHSDAEEDGSCPKCHKDTVLLEDADEEHSVWSCSSCGYTWEEATD